MFKTISNAWLLMILFLKADVEVVASFQLAGIMTHWAPLLNNIRIRLSFLKKYNKGR
ncbi:hypothetical protein PAECIP111891_05845 [Paenibacillus allorhizoplanae]|uniref:Uncharacterized protein n=1 Tax=Paenibacillus allorhizoplanae TaxID=2905648 RepID=A0ABM9CVV7_9BACL|nr:hypothetical protein PAECIP111891_05845 [Paenibacillus allorhizoplanae]